MARKSNHTDVKLLSHGNKLLVVKGASRLSIREVCSAAGVNLGMFNYHFGSKDIFIERILSDVYHKFLKDFELVEANSPMMTLELQLMLIARFARDNRSLILVLINDVLNGEKTVKRFVKANMKKHFIVLAKTIKTCQLSGEIVDLPLPIVMTQIVGSIGLTNLIPGVLRQVGVKNIFERSLSETTKDLVSDETLKQRVKIILQGLKKR